MKTPKLLSREIRILAPVDSVLDPKELASRLREKFAALCDQVRHEQKIVCDDESLLLLLMASYEEEAK